MLAAIITLMIGVSHPVTCQPVTGGHLGWTDGSVILLDPGVCASIDPRAPVVAQGVGFYALAHEAEHVAGHENEREASCAGLRALPRLLLILRWPSRDRVLASARAFHSTLQLGACTTLT